MVKTTVKSWIAYAAETAYASGSSATTLAMTKAADSVSDLVSYELPVNGSTITLPYVKIKREVVREIGGNQYKKEILGGAFDIVNGDIETYIQTDMAVSMALSATIGAIPDSIMFHWETHTSGTTTDVARLESYGCIAGKYTLNLKTDELPTHQTEWKPFGMKMALSGTTPVLSTTQVAFIVTQPITNNEFSITLKGGTSTTTTIADNVIDLKLVIENTYYDKPEVGDYGVKTPYLEKREVTVDLEFLADPQDIYLQHGRYISELITNIGMVLSCTGWTTITTTNMYVESSDQPQQMPQPGIWKYKMTLKDGEAFTIGKS